MTRPYSNDLRERVAAAVVSGRPCREVARTFDVSVASAVKWSQRLREGGSSGASTRAALILPGWSSSMRPGPRPT